MSDENRIRDLEEQVTALQRDLAKRDEQIAYLESLLRQQQGLGRGGR